MSDSAEESIRTEMAEPKAMEQIREEALLKLEDHHCAMCDGVLINACRIDCGHTFCRHCLNMDKDNRNERGKPTCFICDAAITEIAPSSERDKEIDRLYSLLSTEQRLRRARTKAERRIKEEELDKEEGERHECQDPDNSYEEESGLGASSDLDPFLLYEDRDRGPVIFHRIQTVEHVFESVDTRDSDTESRDLWSRRRHQDRDLDNFIADEWQDRPSPMFIPVQRLSHYSIQRSSPFHEHDLNSSYNSSSSYISGRCYQHHHPQFPRATSYPLYPTPYSSSHMIPILTPMSYPQYHCFSASPPPCTSTTITVDVEAIGSPPMSRGNDFHPTSCTCECEGPCDYEEVPDEESPTLSPRPSSSSTSIIYFVDVDGANEGFEYACTSQGSNIDLIDSSPRCDEDHEENSELDDQEHSFHPDQITVNLTFPYPIPDNITITTMGCNPHRPSTCSECRRDFE